MCIFMNGMGYFAPEYASPGQRSEKLDVFSFGVLCLEVLSGGRNIEESMPLNEMYLSTWVPLLTSLFSSIAHSFI